MQGYVCRCFYERNIYLKSLDLHVTYAGDEADFRRKYAEVISETLVYPVCYCLHHPASLSCSVCAPYTTTRLCSDDDSMRENLHAC